MPPDEKKTEEKKTEDVKEPESPKELARGDNVRVHRLANGNTVLTQLGKVTRIEMRPIPDSKDKEPVLTVELAENGHVIDNVRRPQGAIDTDRNRIWPCFSPAS